MIQAPEMAKLQSILAIKDRGMVLGRAYLIAYRRAEKKGKQLRLVGGRRFVDWATGPAGRLVIKAWEGSYSYPNCLVPLFGKLPVDCQ